MNIKEDYSSDDATNVYFGGPITVAELIAYLAKHCEPDAIVLTNAGDPEDTGPLAGLINTPEEITFMGVPDDMTDIQCDCPACRLERAAKGKLESPNGLN